MQGKESIQLDSQTLTLGDQYIVGDTYQDKGLQRPTRCELPQAQGLSDSHGCLLGLLHTPGTRQKLEGSAQTAKDEETRLGNVESETP